MNAFLESSTFIYDADKKIIEVCKREVVQSSKYVSQVYNIDFSEYLRFYFFQTMFHETIHVLQWIMFKYNMDYSVKNQIIKQSMRVNNGDIRLKGKYILPKIVRGGLASYLYSHYYDYFPEEREAQGISFDTMVKFYEKSFPLKQEVLNLLKHIFADEMFIGYEYITKGSSLVKRFYKIINRIDIFNSFDFSSYSSYERYLYGMPLSLEEFISIETELGVKSENVLEKSLCL